MSLKQLVEDGIDLAFDLLQDLAATALLRTASASSFDFATSQTTPGIVTEIAVRYVEVDTNSKKIENLRKTILLETRDFRQSSEVVIDNVAWKIGTIVQEGRFVSLLEIYR